MNQFFDFSKTQMHALTFLATAVLVLGSYRFIREYYWRPAAPARPWQLDILPGYRPESTSVESVPNYRPALMLDPNRAPIDSLEMVPGIGPVLAERIVAFRERHGEFTAVDSLINVSGIGPKTLEKIHPYFRIEKK